MACHQSESAMNTLRQLADESTSLPMRTIWYLTDLSEARGKHDPWPYLNYLLFILTQAYKEFERRVGQIKSPRGEKTAAILAAIDRQISTFRMADLQAACPGVGLDLIRQVMARVQKEKKIKSLGTGRNAKWEKLAN